MTDILEILTSDHKEVKALLKKLTTDSPPEDCDDLFQKLYVSVKTHAKFEEASVYPILVKRPEDKDKALEGYEEHLQVERLLDALHSMKDDDETCTAKMKVLSEDLNHHITEEEATLFPLLRKAASKQTLETLGQRYQDIKAKAQAKASGASRAATAH